VFRDLEVLLGKASTTSYIHGYNARPERAFANSFHYHPASYIMAFSDHLGDDAMLTARENVECTVRFMTEGASEASGFLKADSMLLVIEGACAVLQNGAFHRERDAGYVPKSVADVFINRG
jgi:hypothetical protein